MSAPVVAVFAGRPVAREGEDAPIARVLEALPEGSVVLDRDRPGVERLARSLAVERGIHVGTLRRDGAPAVERHDDAVFRLRPDVVFASRDGDEDTERVVALARAAGAEVRPLGPGEGSSWADAELTRAQAAEARKRWEDVFVALFSGSREWSDIGRIEEDMRVLPSGSLVIEGDARGLDRYAAAVARVLGFSVLTMPALWDFHDKSAGFRRNEAMARLGPDRLLAYPLDGPGTAGMIDLAEGLAISAQVADRSRAQFRGRLSQVVHCRQEAYDVYIGRGRDPQTDEMGEWGNFYSHRPSSISSVVKVPSPEEAVVRYRRDLYQRIRSGKLDLGRLAALHGKTFGCWCGRGKPCHGGPLAAAAAWAYHRLDAEEAA